MEHSAQPELDRLAADVVAVTALPARWVGAPAQRVAEDVASALFHLCPELEFVGVRIVLPPAKVLEARRAHADVDRAWPSAEEPTLVRSAREARLPIGAMGRHGEVLISAAAGPVPRHAHFLAAIAANHVEAACRALDLERDIAQAHEKLAALGKLGALGQLVGGVAHEVRTPLTYATNNLFALAAALRREHGEAVAATAAPHLREIEEALDRIEAIVKQLRKFAKQEVANSIQEDMRDLIRDALRLWRATHVGAAEVHERLLPTPPIAGDRGQLQQVVLNLVQNAADATGPGGCVTVESHDAGDDALLVVADDGAGMAADVVAQLFQPFHTTKRDGLGLGLSIVRGIVEAHRGSIRIDSAPGQGTRVEVRIPRAPAGATAT